MTKSTPVKLKPPGLKRKVFQHYRGMTIYRCTDLFMGYRNMIANPKDFYAVMLTDGVTWLYNEGDDPTDFLMFFQPRWARDAIDQYIDGQRKWRSE
jgi:hypothetical protein